MLPFADGEQLKLVDDFVEYSSSSKKCERRRGQGVILNFVLLPTCTARLRGVMTSTDGRTYSSANPMTDRESIYHLEDPATILIDITARRAVDLLPRSST
jgi:hypothetical protein